MQKLVVGKKVIKLKFADYIFFVELFVVVPFYVSIVFLSKFTTLFC